MRRLLSDGFRCRASRDRHRVKTLLTMLERHQRVAQKVMVVGNQDAHRSIFPLWLARALRAQSAHHEGLRRDGLCQNGGKSGVGGSDAVATAPVVQGGDQHHGQIATQGSPRPRLGLFQRGDVDAQADPPDLRFERAKREADLSTLLTRYRRSSKAEVLRAAVGRSVLIRPHRIKPALLVIDIGIAPVAPRDGARLADALIRDDPHRDPATRCRPDCPLASPDGKACWGPDPRWRLHRL